jgi:TonB family protein
MTSYAFQPTVLASIPESAFSTLPRVRAPWVEFAFGIAAQTLIVGSIVWARMLYPSVVIAPEHNFRSVLLVSTPQPVNLQPQPPLVLRQPTIIAHLDPVESPLRLPARQPKATVKPRIEDETAPAVSLAPKKLEPMVSEVAPVIPQEAVKTNVFSTGSSAPPTMARTPAQVQTGGFGDPNGLPAKADQRKAVTVAALGSFDLPRSSEAGYGNGTGRTKGVPGVVTSAGFGSGTAIESHSHPAVAKVQPSGFGDADVPAAPTVHSHPAETAAVKVVPAEIISKPTPVYTQEARNLRIEGEVLVEAVLQASGSLRVVRVVRGLGHGLDDNAIRAAEKIHFRPALKNGEPADSTVVLHIIFQLA